MSADASRAAPSVHAQSAVDVACALLLFAATLVYIWLQPRHLQVGDESYFLYEAKRIRHGEVMYRDIFQFVTPLASYTMAAVFWLFGTTMSAARDAMAVVHAIIGAALYATARRLHVRREFAVSAALAYLAICYPLYAYASWHWFSTLWTVLLVLSLIDGRWVRNPRAAALPGLVTGIIIGIQQQKGVVLAAGVVVTLALDAVIDYRYSPADHRPPLLRRLAWFAGGVAVVVGPLLAVFAVLAGPTPLYAALVRFPLEDYRRHIGCAWGTMPPLGGGDARFSFPTLLRYSPAALLVPLAEWSVKTAQGRNRQRVRALTVLIVMSAFSALSIRYYPDVIHIAFIAPAFWLCAATGTEWVVSALQPAAFGRVIGALAAGALSVVLLANLATYLGVMRSTFVVAHDTAFGRLDFSSEWEPVFIDAVRQRLAQTESPEMFAYGLTSAYLTTGGRNPTPYQFFEPAVSPPAHTQNTLAILTRRRVPYVVAAPLAMARRNALTRFIEAHYEPVYLPELDATRDFSTSLLYQRQDGTGDTAAPTP